MLFEKGLIKSINSGKCLLVFGSGPSIEVGLPTWGQLATESIEILDEETKKSQQKHLVNLLQAGKYPEIFTIVEENVGLNTLVSWINNKISFKKSNGSIYRLLAEWPFQFFLTTNYDDLLKNFFNDSGVPVISRLNTLSDFRNLRADTTNIVFKIHGDTSDPDNIVLTSKQYDMFRLDPQKEYWREKISSVLHMMDLVIIGYSLSDPDFNDQLERVKAIAQPDRPIYMFAAGFSKEQINDLFLHYNIRIIPYQISNNNHHDLFRVLQRYDPFIAKRNSSNIGLGEVDSNEAEIASSIYLFTQLRLLDSEFSVIGNAYAATILKILFEIPGSESLCTQEIYQALSNQAHAAFHPDPEGFKLALDILFSKGFISVSSSNRYRIEMKGRERLSLAAQERLAIREKFVAACQIFLKSEYKEFRDEEIQKLIDLLETGIVRAFRIRGLEIARAIFNDKQIDLSDGHDLLDIINKSGSNLNTHELSAAYCDLMLQVLIKPNNEMKEYLALLSQGYFAFNALGLDEQGNEQRITLAREKIWIVDSSILIPLLAKDSKNYDYSLDLINRAQELGLQIITTNKLFNEIVGHANWAFQTFNNKPIDEITPSLILAAAGEGGYSENVFIEGFLKWYSKNSNPSLVEYFFYCFGTEFSESLIQGAKKAIESYGIEVKDFEEAPAFSEEYYSLRDEKYCPEVTDLRQRIGTYKGEDQCIAEAEVLVLAEKNKAQFLSLSTILNQIAGRRITWRPDAFFRFLSLFSKSKLDPSLFYDSLTQDLFSAGIQIVDSDSIAKFASSGIKQARMVFEKEKSTYIDALGAGRYKELQEKFESISDTEKQFYSIQIANLVAMKEREKRLDAEKKSESIKQTKKLNDKERMEYEKLKAAKKQKSQEREKKRRRRKSRN